jgi:hypothetical protein
MTLLRECIRLLLIEDQARREQLAQDLYDAGWVSREVLDDPVGPEMKSRTRNIMKAGRVLKQAFAKNADRGFLDSLITVHWMRDRGRLENFIQGNVSSRDELSTSVYLPDRTEAIAGSGAFGPYGVIVKGHITLLANDMDQLYTGKGGTYTYIDPQRTKMSGANKGVQQKYEPGEYAEDKILVLGEEDWDPNISSGGKRNNEALVDNWTPSAFIVPEGEMAQLSDGTSRSYVDYFERQVKKAGLDIPVLSRDELGEQL